jgi:hypothetical protein
MKAEEQDSIKNVITGRFITAVDYLVDSGRISSVVELAQITGIRPQRITGMKASVAGEAKTPQYVGINQLKLVKDHFNVSMDYIFDGIKPIVIDTGISQSVTTETPVEYRRKNLEMKEQIDLLKQKIEFLNEKVEFYKEKLNQKP